MDTHDYHAEHEHLADEWHKKLQNYYGDAMNERARAELISRCTVMGDPLHTAWVLFCNECRPVMPSAFVDALRHIGHDWWCAEVVRQWDNFFEAM